MAAMHADGAGGGDDARAGDDAGRDAAAQGEDGFGIGAEIGDGGEAGVERLHGEACAVDGVVGAGLEEFIEARCRGPARR